MNLIYVRSSINGASYDNSTKLVNICIIRWLHCIQNKGYTISRTLKNRFCSSGSEPNTNVLYSWCLPHCGRPSSVPVFDIKN